MKLIVTHKAPDIDSIGAVWQLKRFAAERFAQSKVVFVDAGERLTSAQAAESGEQAEDIVYVDTGHGEFDHHETESGTQRVCAASLVYDFLCELHPERKTDWALQHIVEYALVDDHFEDYFWTDAAAERHLFALRSILHGLEFTQLHDDDSQMAFGMKCFDGIYASLKERKKAMEEMAAGVEFTSPWGRAIGLSTSNQAVLRYAQLTGYVLVIQKDPKKGNIRIKAAPLPTIDLTALHTRITAKDSTGSWFFHPGKHMVLNGSSKKPGTRPSPLTLEEVIAIAKETRI